MKEFAAKLLKLDNNAKAILEDAAAYCDKVRADTVAEQEKVLAEYENHAKRHIQAVDDTESTATREEAELLEKRYQALTSSLEEVYQREHEAWEEELYQLCLETWRSGEP